MCPIIRLQVSPDIAADPALLEQQIRKKMGLSAEKPCYFQLNKKSIDARSRQVKINLDFLTDTMPIKANPVSLPLDLAPTKLGDKTALIAGCGPAGLFAALRCLHLGVKPILIERGKNIRDRRRDLAALTKMQEVNPESNYCFGEGGAGTYSDGKLYTRSNKRGSIKDVLEAFVFFGADPKILIESHPHIGTNKLPQVIERIRLHILEHGGEIFFQHKLTGISVVNHKLRGIEVQDLVLQSAREINANALVLATGHSARDIYHLLYQNGIQIESKPFALGVRMEHPQELIDCMQYHCKSSELHKIRANLPAASYSLVAESSGHGVYSFCMCPGGIIAPCATAPGEIVTNGWSPSKRNNPFANSGLVTEIKGMDLVNFSQMGPFTGLSFQEDVEKKAWQAGGGGQVAPAQRLLDFIQKKSGQDLPECSYLPGTKQTNLWDVLPPGVARRLQDGIQQILKTRPMLASKEGILVATESRTSTPVRIPRDAVSLQHPQVIGLFPCGEGAGYAGGIVSAAMDGINCATALTMV